MPLDLAALVVEAGAVSAEDMERALARQREAGGTLDTALLELGLLPHDEVVRFLSRASGLPPPPPGSDEADPRARRVFPARVAERHGLAPFRLDGRELSVLATSPVDLAALDEISFMLSLSVVPHVAPEWRVRALQARLYGSTVPPRVAALAAAMTSPPPPPSAPPQQAAASPEPAGPAPEAAPPPPTSAAVAREGAFGVAPEEPLAAALAQALEAAEAEVLRAGAAAPHRDEAPPRWSVDEASAALGRASGRDEVVSVALRYARDFFEAVALFAVARDRVSGHDAAGWEGARERCRAVRVRAADVALFRTAVEAGGPHLGPITRGGGNEELVAALGRAWPRVALVYPILLRDRTVAVVYADNGAAPVSARRVGDLLLVLGAVGGAFERILREAKRASGGPPAEARPASGDEAAWQAREPARADAAPPPPSPPADAYEVGAASDAFASTGPFDAAEAVRRLAASARGSELRSRLVADLVRHGPEAAAALAGAFPGPLDATSAEAEALPCEERGPVLAALFALGRVATPYLVQLLDGADAGRRRMAALLAGRVADPAAFLPLADRALDDDPAVADAALAALAALRGHEEFPAVLARLRKAVLATEAGRPAQAARALARLGDAGAVPLLVQALDAPAPVASAAQGALEALTARRFGADADAWLAWWREHRQASRADWIFSALEDEDREVRLAAADLLRAAAPSAVRYFADAPAPERTRSARAWRAYFEEQGYAL